MTEPALIELVSEPDGGRAYEMSLMPGIADANGAGRVRVDAIARWLQDVAYHDLIDAGFTGPGVWIVRRARLRIEVFPRFGERLVARTFCSGLGRFSAERRTTVTGASARVESVGLWVWLDAETLRPSRFPPEFVDLYAASTAGRDAPVRLRHPQPPEGCERRPWRFRAADVDAAGHVNNSHHWAPLEEEFSGAGPRSFDAEIEYRDPAMPGDAVVLSDGDWHWIAAPAGGLHASIRVAARG